MRRSVRRPKAGIDDRFKHSGALPGHRSVHPQTIRLIQVGCATAHFHKTISESFFILSGTLRLFNGESWIDATAGDFLYVPEGGVHGFHNESDEPASLLPLFAPGAPREAYFEALAEKAAGRRFSDEEWNDICRSHDNYFI